MKKHNQVEFSDSDFGISSVDVINQITLNTQIGEVEPTQLYHELMEREVGNSIPLTLFGYPGSGKRAILAALRMKDRYHQLSICEGWMLEAIASANVLGILGKHSHVTDLAFDLAGRKKELDDPDIMEEVEVVVHDLYAHVDVTTSIQRVTDTSRIGMYIIPDYEAYKEVVNIKNGYFAATSKEGNLFLAPTKAELYNSLWKWLGRETLHSRRYVMRYDFDDASKHMITRAIFSHFEP